MKFENLLELIKTVSDSNLTTFKFEEGETKITMHAGETAITPVATPAAVTTVMQTVSAEMADKAEVVEKKQTGNIVKSPLVGTFYAAPSEDAEDFVKVGDTVKSGQVLAIIEAMKLMNDINSDFDGIITEILVKNGEPVEYGQPLFCIS
ncbi:MAG: acetyl-CoA carboxylase biotin carboxyl carrier protein [Lachnospiraceae bacterium]|nr:acetyl-CoA carboxylase biotin carboxyl carrier protein [Lachnospiraceae bacterium]